MQLTTVNAWTLDCLREKISRMLMDGWELLGEIEKPVEVNSNDGTIHQFSGEWVQRLVKYREF